ncbi:MAG: GNAT family N-acetyltransferase [Actinomycetes bacterium]
MADVSVRPARLVDVEPLVELQRRVWAALPADIWAVPDVADLDAAAMGRSWERAVLVPPTPRHRLLVALDGDVVVGALALTPADDPDLRDPDSGVDELALLVVDPPYRRRGHGSRLMAAAVDVVVPDGVATIVAWVPAADDEARSYLEGAGFAVDGAFRSVEAQGRTVRELRFVTDLGPEAA